MFRNVKHSRIIVVLFALSLMISSSVVNNPAISRPTLAFASAAAVANGGQRGGPSLPGPLATIPATLTPVSSATPTPLTDGHAGAERDPDPLLHAPRSRYRW
jgi:hypothetical protein